MKCWVLFAAVLHGAVVAQPQPAASQAGSAPAALVRITDGGELEEIERAGDFSVIEIRRAPAGSVPSSLFALRGACAVARAREMNYFASTPHPGPVRAYRITFPQAPTESQLSGSTKTVFARAECDLLRY